MPLHLGLRFRLFLLFDYYGSYLDLKRKIHLLLNVVRDLDLELQRQLMGS
jgi:hypothetical protein